MILHPVVGWGWGLGWGWGGIVGWGTQRVELFLKTYSTQAGKVAQFICWRTANTIHPKYLLGAGIAQWLERRTCDRKVAGSNPCRSGRRIFYSRVDFLC